MSRRITSSRRVRIAAPVAACQRFFTPAGEELWVDGWRPRYVSPADGRTEAGMVFTTGSGDEHTVWTLLDYDTDVHYARYARVTPALRTGFVEVRCARVDDATTDVDVRYTLTALSDAGARTLDGFEGEAYAEMIDGWKREIDARLPALLAAAIR